MNMLKRSNTLPAKKKVGSNKFVLGFAAIAATAVIGATGIVAAAPNTKPTKEQCAAAGFENYGQCVKQWAQGKKGYGGYGGGNTNTANVNVNVNGNNNVIHIILQFFN
jgi:hypothetical protein